MGEPLYTGPIKVSVFSSNRARHDEPVIKRESAVVKKPRKSHNLPSTSEKSAIKPQKSANLSKAAIKKPPTSPASTLPTKTRAPGGVVKPPQTPEKSNSPPDAITKNPRASDQPARSEIEQFLPINDPKCAAIPTEIVYSPYFPGRVSKPAPKIIHSPYFPSDENNALSVITNSRFFAGMPSCSPRPRGLNKLSVESNGGADPISDVTQEAVINPNSLALEKKAGQEVGAASTASLLGKNAGQVDTSSSIASRLEKFRYDPSRPVEPRTPVLVDPNPRNLPPWLLHPCPKSAPKPLKKTKPKRKADAQITERFIKKRKPVSRATEAKWQDSVATVHIMEVHVAKPQPAKTKTKIKIPTDEKHPENPVKIKCEEQQPSEDQAEAKQSLKRKKPISENEDEPIEETAATKKPASKNEVLGPIKKEPAKIKSSKRPRGVKEDKSTKKSLNRKVDQEDEDEPLPKLPPLPWPPLSHEKFGLIQEDLNGNSFHIIIAAMLCNRTHGADARPYIFQLISDYPTPDAMSKANKNTLSNFIKPLGLQNIRAAKLVEMSRVWIECPPKLGCYYGRCKAKYPSDKTPGFFVKGQLSRGVCKGSRFEVDHLPGVGAYAIDSWRVFGRDVLFGARERGEWRRVVSGDRPLRSYLRWRWTREGVCWHEEGDEVGHMGFYARWGIGDEE